MKISNGPATVNGEKPFDMPLGIVWEGEGESRIHESGDLPRLFGIDLTRDKGYTG